MPHPRRVARQVFTQVAATFVFAAFTSLGLSAQPSSTSPQTPSAGRDQRLTEQLEQMSRDQADLKSRALRAEEQLAALGARIETGSSYLQWGGGLLAIIVSLITIASLSGFIRSEKRATEAHALSLAVARDAEQRTANGFALAFAGESAAQQRADEVHQTFLSGSKNTLDLVNATLTLAKEASERAAKSVEARAMIILKELDADAKDLLDSVTSQDDRALVSEPDKTAALRSLAQRIEGFHNFRLVLPESIQLPPECLFIRGMDFHLKQQFVDAFRSWREVAHRTDSEPALRSKAWYWIGYEQNNLAEFADACVSFERALENTDGSRRFELQRLLIESRFFDEQPEQPLLASLNALNTSAKEIQDDGVSSVRTKILCTIGNIHLSLGNRMRASNGVDLALPHYESAKAAYEEARTDKWAYVGLAEALYWLGDPVAESMFERDIRDMAQKEEIRRIEPRTKVLAKTTELICCLRVPRFRTQVHTIHSQLTEALGRVEGRLTVYSQVQRRNVTKQDFMVDLLELMKEENGLSPRGGVTGQGPLPA